MADADWSDIFQSAGQQYGVDPDLLRAVATTESSGNPNAVSPVGARGLMQLMPETAKSLGVTDPTDPKQAIPAAARLLVQNGQQFSTPEGAVLAYHGGTDQKNWGPKTQAYLAKVSQTYQQLKNGSSMPTSPQSQAQNDAFSAAFSGNDSSPAQSGPSNDNDAFAAAFGSSKATTPASKTAYQYPPGDSRNLPATMTITRQDALPQQSATASGVPASAAPSTQAIASHPFTMGDEVMSKIPFAKDVVAGGTALLDKGADLVTGKSGQGLSATYQANMNALTDQQKKYEAENPNKSAIASGIGVVASGKPSAAMLSAAPQTLGQLVKGGAQAGAMAGTLFGLGTPNEGPQTVNGRAGNALIGGVTGAALGGVLPVAAAPVAAAGRAIGSATNKLFPSVDQKASAAAKGIIDKFAGGTPLTPNTTQIVPGSAPTLGESVDNPGVSLLQKQVTQLNPNSPLLARQAENSAARGAHLESAVGTPTDIQLAEKARDTAATTQTKTIFDPGNIKPVDVAPVQKTITEILNGKSGSRPAVQSAMNDVKAMLTDANTSDPETLYRSVRAGIGDLIGGKDLTKSYGKQAASQLLEVQKSLDDAIETGAPGFKSYLNDYAKASSPIDAMRFLQGLNLTDTTGNIQLSKVQTAMRNLQAQRAAAGIKPGKHVSDPQMDALTSLRDDMTRATNLDKGKARGSDTAQNAIFQESLGLAGQKPSIVKKYASKVAGAAIGAGIGHFTGVPLAEEGLGYVGNVAGEYLADRAATKTAQYKNLLQNHLENMLLNPQAYNAPAAQSIPPTLNQLMNGSRVRTGLKLGNNLAVLHQLGARNSSGSP